MVSKGVFVGRDKNVVPLDDPDAPDKTHRAILDGISYAIEMFARPIKQDPEGHYGPSGSRSVQHSNAMSAFAP